MTDHVRLLMGLLLIAVGTAHAQDRPREDRGEDIQLVCYGGAAITIDGIIKFSGRCDPDDGHRRF